MERKLFKKKISIRTLLGLTVCLFAIIGFLSLCDGVVNNNGTRFLSYIFAYPIIYLFGFVGFWAFFPILLMFGVVILFRGKFESKRVNPIVIGLILVFISACIMCSQYIGVQYCNAETIGNENNTIITYFCIKNSDPIYLIDNNGNAKQLLDGVDITFNNQFSSAFFYTLFKGNVTSDIANKVGGVGEYYGAWVKATSSDPEIYESIISNYNLAGGFIGYAVAGSLSTVGNWLTWLVSIVIIGVGLGLVFHESIGNAFRKIKDLIKGKRNKDNSSNNDVEVYENEVPRPINNEYNQIAYSSQQIEQKPINILPEPRPVQQIAYSSPYNFQSNSNFNNSGLVAARFYDEDDINKPDISSPQYETKVRDDYPSHNQSNYSNSLKPFANEMEDELDTKPQQNNSFVKQVEPVHNYIKEEPVVEPVHMHEQKHEIIEEQIIDLNYGEETKPMIKETVKAEEKVTEPTIVEPQITSQPVSQARPQPIPVTTTEVFKNEFYESKVEKGVAASAAILANLDHYEYPSANMLNKYDDNIDELIRENSESCDERMEVINGLFRIQKVNAQVTTYTVGPSITRFDVEYLDNGLTSQVGKIINDISVRLGGVPTRFTPIVLGRSTSGLEVANKKRMTVSLRECIEQLPERTDKNATMFCYGKDISGEYKNSTIAKAPHMLVAGTTGSGKSVFIHSMLTTLIMRNSPDELRLILVDPKRVEMLRYKELPHLLCPVITDPYKAKVALDKLVQEMEARYDLMAQNDVNNISLYNKKAREENFALMPTIICFIDEFADLVENCKDVCRPVSLLGAKSRACGIHLILATQHPTVNVVNSSIKSNIPVRVALNVKTGTDSSVILDEVGAETLLGNGDMLVSDGNLCPNACIRVQGAFVDDDEAYNIIKAIKLQRKPNYVDEFMNLEDAKDQNDLFNEAIDRANKPSKSDMLAASDDELFERVKDYAFSRDFVSISSIQRDFSIGFNRAGKMIIRLREDGVIAPNQEPGAKGCRVIRHNDVEEVSMSEGSSQLVKEYVED